MFNKIYKLSTQKLLLLVPFINWWIILIFALSNARFLDRQVGGNGIKSIYKRFMLHICIIITISGLIFTGYLIIIIFNYNEPMEAHLMILGIYFFTLLLGISLIIYQKKQGIDN